MTDRYVSFESVGIGTYLADTHVLTAARHDIDVVTEELTPERNNVYAVTSDGRTPRRKLPGPLGWTGNIETLLYTIAAPSLLYYAMGTHSIALDDPVTSLNTHTITPNQNAIPHFILEVGRDLVGHRYTGVVATGFSLEYAPDSAVTMNVDVNARKEQSTASLDTVTFPDFDAAERTYGGVEVVTSIGAAEAGVSVFTTVESYSLTYENNFEDSAYALGNQFLTGNFSNQINITGSMEFSFLQITDYDDVVGDVEKNLELDMNNGDGAVVSQRGITIKHPRISYDSTSIPTNNAERYVQSLEFTCNDNAAGDALLIEIINEEVAAEFVA